MPVLGSILRGFRRSSDRSTRSRRALIVDHDRRASHFFEAALVSAGYFVVTAVGDEQAVAKFRACRPLDVVLINGAATSASADLVRELRATDPKQKILYLTNDKASAVSRPSNVDEAVLQQPCTPVAVVEAIAQLLGAYRQHRPTWT
jgi:DNA-binding response OmpR family regulator